MSHPVKSTDIPEDASKFTPSQTVPSVNLISPNIVNGTLAGTPSDDDGTSKIDKINDGTPSNNDIRKILVDQLGMHELGQFGTAKVSQDGTAKITGTGEMRQFGTVGQPNCPKVEQQSGRVGTVGQSGFEHEQQIRELLGKYPKASIRKISEISKLPRSTVHRIIQRIRPIRTPSIVATAVATTLTSLNLKEQELSQQQGVQFQSQQQPFTPLLIPASLVEKVPELGKFASFDAEWFRDDFKENRQKGIS